jgi:hypothetical protein
MSRYFGLTNLYTGEQTPLKAEYYAHRDSGWIDFIDASGNLVAAIPGSGVAFFEVTREDYEYAVEEMSRVDSDVDADYTEDSQA